MSEGQTMCPKAVAIDFDGTCVIDKWPEIGPEVPGCVRVLKRLTDIGHKLVLWTVRHGKDLDDAVQWFKDRDIPLAGINDYANPDDRLTPSPKIYYDILIDDRSCGWELVYDFSVSDKGFVDWNNVERYLERNGLIWELPDWYLVRRSIVDLLNTWSWGVHNCEDEFALGVIAAMNYVIGYSDDLPEDVADNPEAIKDVVRKQRKWAEEYEDTFRS